ncbi:MAG TPA: 2-(1,2-epoxy-1,2-dihydrophenyl)acetyl-CoA isomerase PaaG [Alphaproteobacteria bacterium]|nr:2-(1,2-epoxy-1,2-dihydrophenyl)acetyl-CoA isomerase PaaG [Alphaproteobacteria bacterium]
MTYQTIQFALDDGVAKITLNRPDRLNAFTPEMHRELKDALARAAQDARAVLLTGAGRGFCAGQDLSQRRGNDVPDLGATIHDLYNPLIRAMRALEMPIVAAVNGVAAGAGMSLALASDIALAARSATFLQAFVKVGLVPDSGSTYFLPRLAGIARARALAMLGEKITAEEAASWGLIWKVVDDDQLLAEALRLARHLATQPTRALALIKRAFNATLTNDLDAQLDLERDLQRIAGMTDDYREGVAAFFEKRPPRFVGR